MEPRERKYRSSPRGRLITLVQRARKRARRLGVLATIKPGDLRVPVFCPVLDIPLGHGGDTPRYNLVSLDRIVPEEGYIPGNVRVISMRANMLKNDATIEELRAVLADAEKLAARVAT